MNYKILLLEKRSGLIEIVIIVKESISLQYDVYRIYYCFVKKIINETNDYNQIVGFKE